MSNVFYIRLLTGDEVVAEIIDDTKPENIVLDNPLLIETSGDEEGHQMIFLSRFNPYAHDTSMIIDRHNVLLIQTASEVMSEYYSKSVDFCKCYVDKKFTHGITSATSYVDKVLKQLMISGEVTEEFESQSEEEEFIDEQEKQTGFQKPTVH